MKTIYLDYAAATRVDKKVMKAMEPYFTEQFYNPSALYLAGRRAKNDLDQARSAAAACLGARPAEIIFTSGATESNNLAISGVMSNFPGAELLVSAIEHKSVLEPAIQLGAKQIQVNKYGLVEIDKLKSLITAKSVLISIGLVNNEISTLQPIKDISILIEQINKARRVSGNKLPLYLHSDVAQAGNCFDLHVSRLGVDLMTLNGGKIYGPKNSGLLYNKAGVKLSPMILGGGQEMGLRSGTESLASAVGLSAALKLAQSQKNSQLNHLNTLKSLFIKELNDKIPRVQINSPIKHSSPHIVSVTFIGSDNERLMMELDEQGVMVATGSACSAAKGEPSHVLKAIGLSDEMARSTLRFSFGRQSSAKEIKKVAGLLGQLIH